MMCLIHYLPPIGHDPLCETQRQETIPAHIEL